jgi:hypothetical protein
MNSFIYELWEITINYGYNTRKNKKDGLESWNYYKKLIPDCKIEWKDTSKNIYINLQDLGVNADDNETLSGMTREKWERHHYLIQHGRIIYNNPSGSLVRLLQIAYNIGQFRVELEKKIYPIEQLQYYILHELNKVTTYISDIILDKNIGSKIGIAGT